MPHQCTNCRLTFDDGSKEMLGGCPECGGNKFQFLPKGATEDRPVEASVGATRTETAPTPAARPSTAPASDSPPGTDGDADIIEAPAEPVEPEVDFEDRAQASARRAVVSEDELPPTSDRYAEEEPAAPAPEPDRPDLTQLREELNEQFESIKILRPGEYELNLMELYDRQEYIIALEEDGRYVIDVPDTWRDDG